MTVQRDYGDRSDRKHARLKYTIERIGLDAFVAAVEARLGFKLAQARKYAFTGNGDRLGWVEGDDGTHGTTACSSRTAAFTTCRDAAC